ncbi:MAG: Nuclear control of ATPase protein 2 [Icmadophila ericetorum]|nr:Nuclear control of ATPase protein 2 [Icmadophila ericetorum]
MSFVADQVRRIDAQLDRLQLSSRRSVPGSPILRAATDGSQDSSASELFIDLPRVNHLQSAIKSLSTSSSSRPMLSSYRLQELLRQIQDLNISRLSREELHADSVYEQDLEWLLVSKATTQTYGLILNTLLEQTIPLSNDIWYWDDVLSSYTYSALYTVQTSPLRFWHWTLDIYGDAKRRLDSLTAESDEVQASQSLSNRWRQFYGLVRASIHDRSMANMQSRFMSPLIMCRAEARRKQNHLKKLRELSASGLGVLMDEGLAFDTDEEGSITSKAESDDGRKEEWQNIVSKSIALMETVLRNVTTLETAVNEFEDSVFVGVEEDPEVVRRLSQEGSLSRPAILLGRLQNILADHIPNHVSASNKLAREYGRPSRLIRYWLPATVLILSSSTVLRILVNRKTEITTWLRDLGSTVVHFWYNWVVDPVKKVIGTIRHDKDSEIALMSKESLQGDRASLERMVVDFAVDNLDTSSATGASLTEGEIAAIRLKVKEGDLTPVLKAYERDLRKPFMGTVRGDLIRALLIQVQKTKVDVEVAVGGIDALLKSQELVFGFVGLTPGILVCLGVSRWLNGFFGGRRGRTRNQKQGRMIRVLRNIDRILTAATPLNNGMLSYKEHGLLLCEVHILRSQAQSILPGEINREFLEEINDLVDIRTGVERQHRVVERMQWAYSKWMR